jgi:diguanylate cyclase (GGDEF)-like protein/PAS domain S-box-containing protein
MNPDPLPLPDAPAETKRRWTLPEKGSLVRNAIFCLAFIAVYFLLDSSDILLESHLGFAIWYPPLGIAIPALLGLSPWYAPLIYLAGMISGRMIYHEQFFTWTGIVTPISVAAWYAAAAYMLRSRARIDTELSQRRDVVWYVLVMMSAALGSAVVGVTSLLLDHAIALDRYSMALLGWYAGDLIAIVGVAPFFLVHVFPWIRKRLAATPETATPVIEVPSRWESQSLLPILLETVGQAASILVVLWIMFVHPFESMQLYFLSFLPILWIAMRQGVRKVVTGLLAFNFGIVLALQLAPQTPEGLVNCGILMLSISLAGLIVGTAVTERHRISNDLLERTTFLNALIENNPLGIVVLDRKGLVQMCNDAFERLFQFRRSELAGKDLDSVIIHEDTGETDEIAKQTHSADGAQPSVRRIRKDGSVLDVELQIVPLRMEGRIRGSFGIYKDVSKQIEAAEVAKAHAESLNSLVSELQLRTTQMTLLNEMGDMLQCCGSRDEAYGIVARSARKIFPIATSGSLFVFRSSRNALEIGSTWGRKSATEPTTQPDDCWALRRGRANWSESPDGGIVCQHIKHPVAASYLCVPLAAQGDVLGILHLQYDRSESAHGTVVFETLQESQQRLATSVASQIALSLASLNLRETLRDQSIRDPLTGLFNRRFMQESLDRELLRAKRKKHSLTVLFLDLDHFKRFNDTFGHEAGDLVLRSMADLFREYFRGDDVVCRYGGEEFAIILPESSAKDAVDRADKLRADAKKLQLKHQGRTLDRVSISAGVASFPEHGSTAEELLRVADQGLYQSKAEGRDRVTVATALKV